MEGHAAACLVAQLCFLDEGQICCHSKREFVREVTACLFTLLAVHVEQILHGIRRGVGDLVLVYKRVTSLAGHTSRVAELLEQVQRLSAGNPDDTTRSLCAPRSSGLRLCIS